MLMTDQVVRQRYEKKGFEYAKQFTWMRYYEGLMKVIS